MPDRFEAPGPESETAAPTSSDISSWWLGPGLYLALLSMQTVGAVILLSNMIPIYRMMALDFANYQPDFRPWWAVSGVVLVQIAYWLRILLQPSLPRAESVILGHLVLFVARLSFVAVTSGFSTMFLSRIEDLRRLDCEPLRALIVIVIFFTLFFWTLDLERLGRALRRNWA